MDDVTDCIQTGDSMLAGVAAGILADVGDGMLVGVTDGIPAG